MSNDKKICSSITKKVKFDSMSGCYNVTFNGKTYRVPSSLKYIKRLKLLSPYAHLELAVNSYEENEVLKLISQRNEYCEQLKAQTQATLATA